MYSFILESFQPAALWPFGSDFTFILQIAPLSLPAFNIYEKDVVKNVLI